MRKVIFLMMFILVMTIVPSSVSADEQGKEMYYYIMIDRFQNSDASKENIDINDPIAHHGGDFLGIQNRIDHFKQIGVTSVILSPIFESGTYSGFESVNYIDKKIADLQSTYAIVSENLTGDVQLWKKESLLSSIYLVKVTVKKMLFPVHLHLFYNMLMFPDF